MASKYTLLLVKPQTDRSESFYESSLLFRLIVCIRIRYDERLTFFRRSSLPPGFECINLRVIYESTCLKYITLLLKTTYVCWSSCFITISPYRCLFDYVSIHLF